MWSTRWSLVPLCMLLHRRCFVGDMSSQVAVLHDGRNWMALVAWQFGNQPVLYISAHLDPDFTAAELTECLVAMGAICQQLSPAAVVLARDLNTLRTARSVLARQLRPGHVLDMLHLD